MKILVTGANGYIGSKVVTKLCDLENEVIATDFKNDNIDKRATFIKADILNEEKNWFDFFNKPDVCLHLAWKDGFVHESKEHMINLSKHFIFLNNLISNGLKHLTIMGTMHEVGYFEGCITEDTITNPKTLYAISKDALRKSLENICEKEGVIFQWLRGFYIYGNDNFGNSIFCKLRQASANGEKTFPFTDGKNKFDFISVDELANQISYCVLQDKINGIINTCSGKPVSLSEKIEWYIKENNLKIKLDYGKFPNRPFESPCIYGDNSKINEIIACKQIKVLVTGVNGQLGYDCLRELKKRGYVNVLGIDKDDLDITNENDVTEFICKYKPDVVLHNAAWTQVDLAEQMPEKVYAVNSLGSKYIASACKKVGAKMVYISTDYVFDGKGDCYFDVDDPKNGLSVYGKSKLAGEEYVRNILDKHFIIRTSWVFGYNGNNFIKTMIKLAKAGKKELNVVCDQIGSPTYTVDLAKLICDMIETEKYGTYHGTNSGICSWAELTSFIFDYLKYDVKVNYVTTEEYMKIVPNQAKRPLNSRMSKKKLVDSGFDLLPDWQDGVERYLKEIE